MPYRVAIYLAQRVKGGKPSPVFHYTANLHEAKFLAVNIQVYGDSFRNARLRTLIQTGEKIEKVTRLQKLMRLMVFAKEKRFVQMYNFQNLAVDMIDVALQGTDFGRVLAQKWLTSMLDEDDKPIIRSSFRSEDPQANPSAAQGINERALLRAFKVLKRFIQNRGSARAKLLAKEIKRQLSQESEGIVLESLSWYETIRDRSGVDRFQPVMQIDGNGAALVLDPCDAYRWMIFENRCIQSRREQAPESLMRKIDLGEVSWIATDLDQMTQFDYSNKMNK